jgi:hypothetical protein
MSTRIEQELRLALAARAAELPPDASGRLLSFDYQPHTPHVRSAVALAATMVTAGVILAFSLVSLGSDTPRAFAGWSATPTAPSGDQTRRVQEACLPRLPTSARIEQTQDTASGPHKSWPFPSITTDSWHEVLADTRGPYTVILFVAAHGSAELSCFSGDQPTRASLGGSFATHLPSPVPAGHVSIVSSGSRTTPPDEGSKHFSQLVGRTAPGVTGVILRLRDGMRITASLAKGWFLAWWPGTQYAVAAEVTTLAGTSLRPLNGTAAMAGTNEADERKDRKSVAHRPKTA